MKKFLALALAVIMALTLIACGEKPAPPPDPDPVGNVYNVVYLVNGNLGDKSFFDSAQAGLETLKAAGRIKLNTIPKTAATTSSSAAPIRCPIS